jgi:thiamine-phosphate pyrophosphorylase
MKLNYPEWSHNESNIVSNVALQLYKKRNSPSKLSPLVLLTDPLRMKDINNSIKKLPRGSALVYRHFGEMGYQKKAEGLRELTLKQNIQFLIGNDPDLALAVKADGVHFSRDPELVAPNIWRAKKPDWLISMAGIKTGSYKSDLAILDGLLISSVFQSSSLSAGTPIGIDGLKRKMKNLCCPVFAMGGINKKNAHELIGMGVSGIAGISFGL